MLQNNNFQPIQNINDLENKAFNADTFDILQQIPDESIAFILTDPPYNISNEVRIIRTGNVKKYKANSDIVHYFGKWDDIWKDKKDYILWMFNFIDECYRILQPNRHFVMFIDKLYASFFGLYAESIGFRFRTSWFWEKTNPVPQARGVSPMKSIEQAIWLTKGASKQEFYNYKLGMHSDVIHHPIPTKEGCTIRHPTQKPLFVGLFLTALLSKPNELCFDPFAGNFTFPLAAKLLGRKYLGIEKEAQFYQAGTKRLSEGLSNPDVKKIYTKFMHFMISKKNDRYITEFNYLLNLDQQIFL